MLSLSIGYRSHTRNINLILETFQIRDICQVHFLKKLFPYQITQTMPSQIIRKFLLNDDYYFWTEVRIKMTPTLPDTATIMVVGSSMGWEHPDSLTYLRLKPCPTWKLHRFLKRLQSSMKNRWVWFCPHFYKTFDLLMPFTIIVVPITKLHPLLINCFSLNKTQSFIWSQFIPSPSVSVTVNQCRVRVKLLSCLKF